MQLFFPLIEKQLIFCPWLIHTFTGNLAILNRRFLIIKHTGQFHQGSEQ